MKHLNKYSLSLRWEVEKINNKLGALITPFYNDHWYPIAQHILSIDDIGRGSPMSELSLHLR